MYQENFMRTLLSCFFAQVACDHLDTIADTINFSKDDIKELAEVAKTTLSSKM
jgi:hypothetical protein